MDEKRDLVTKCEETAGRLRQEKEISLVQALLRGKEAKEIREEMKCRKEFKRWSVQTGFSISTLDRDINRYEFHELMQTETGRRTIKWMTVNLVARVNRLRMQDYEKFMELLSYIDQGLDNTGIKYFLDENIVVAVLQLDGKKVREKLEEAANKIAGIDIRRLKHNTGNKIMKTFDTIFKLISECTKLNTEKKSRELGRKIEEINYGIGVLSIS